MYSKSVQGGGGSTGWAGISSRGKTELQFVSGSMDAMDYTTVLESTLEILLGDFYLDRIVFSKMGSRSPCEDDLVYFFEIVAYSLKWGSASLI